MQAQEPALPIDFRQHNLTEYNSSLLSPIYSLDRNQPQSLALWTRWQWQSIDGDPTTIFLNYSRKMSRESGAGIGFFQHNTGVFVNTGGMLNYAHSLELSPRVEIAAGLNIFGFQRTLADDSFQLNPNIPFPQFEESDSFILQLAPSFRFKVDQFSLGMVIENLIDYNISTSESQVSNNGRVFIGLASYHFPLSIFPDWGDSYLQPTLYVKRLPDFENQVGITTLFSTPKFWAQAGYNSFYGISGGVGGRFFKGFSIGALIEYGTKPELGNSDPTLEFVTAYNFGSQNLRKRIVGFKVKDDEEILVDLQLQEDTAEEENEAVKQLAEEERKAELAKQQNTKDSIAEVAKLGLLAEQARKREKEKDSLAAVERAASLRMAKLREQQRLDSIAAAEWALAKQTEAQRKQDSTQQVQAALAEAARTKVETLKTTPQKEVVQLKAGEKYEEAVNEEGLVAGYYLIANVFGTKRYYEAFMKTLTNKGLSPESFYRKSKKFNYVYLARYNSIDEARKARDSKFNGQYNDKTWIFRVVVE